MKVSRVVRERIRIAGKGVNLVGDLNTAIAVNAGEKGGLCTAHASDHRRIAQEGSSRRTRDGRR